MSVLHKCIAPSVVGGGIGILSTESNGWQVRDATAKPILDVQPFTAVLTELARRSAKPLP